MCGIAGFAGRGTRTDLQRMTSHLAHRGPDAEGLWVDDNAPVFLGHRRLSILDHAGGDQPMWNEDKQVGVIFNGEIYNFQELRHELERLGHRFATSHSDTEVLVHGYEEWGDGLPLRLNGMFAFAIYDIARGSLFLARDRFGEKPLYYSAKSDLFVFASELTSLTQHPEVSRSLSEKSLQKYFAYGYLPAPHAMLEGSRKLPGGHWLKYDISSQDLTVKPYWQFSLEPDNSLCDADEPRLIDELSHLLGQAARRRLMSDVPLGVFLSGGLDSSAVLACLAEQMPASELRTYTIGFNEPSFDESAHARHVANYLGTEHHERILGIDQVRDLIPDILGKLDEPLGDASILPTSILSGFAREQVTVALTGDGGDELFAGYDPFLALKSAEIYSHAVPSWAHRAARGLAGLIPVSSNYMSLDFKLKRTLMGLSYPQNARLPAWMSPVEPSDLAELMKAPVRVDEIYDEAIALWDGDRKKPIVDRALEFFTCFYLQDDILMKTDRASMMHSLETRAVFLDNDLVEFCRRLPNHFKFRKGERKYLLKKVADSLLPREIVERRKKGFGIPLTKWLRTVPADPPLDEIQTVNMSWVRKAWRQHRSRSMDHRLFLFAWLSLQHFVSQLKRHRYTR